MTKRQEQWMEVGKAYETPMIERTGGQTMLASAGLCNAMNSSPSLKRTFDCECYGSPTTHQFRFRRRRDYVRALFAYLMAAMTDKERDAIVVGL